MGSFWTSLGVYVATFRVKRLNHGKPTILLEKRRSDAHGGGQGVAIFGVLGQKTRPKSTQGRPKRAKRHTKTRRRGSKGHRRGAERTTRPPKSEKVRFGGFAGGGGGPPKEPKEPKGTPGAPHPPCRQSLVGAPPQSLCRDSESKTLQRLC